MDIRLATPTDIPALMALESRNYVGNLSEAERADGFISVLHPQAWFEAAVEDGGIHLAESDDEVVSGFIAVIAPPTGPDDFVPPIVGAMMDLAGRLTFNGQVIAQQHYALRGPVVIDRAARGQGVYSAFNAVTQEAYRERFDLAVLFVAADNPRSLHTTTTKLGAQPLAEFEVASQRYQFMALSYR